MTQSAQTTFRNFAKIPVVAPTLGVLTVVTLGAFCLRAIGLDSQLWYDEIYSLVVTTRPPLGEILTTYYGDIQHPLNSVLGNLAIRLLGEAPWTVRLPAFLFGTASIPLIFQVGRDLGTPREGLLAALFLAVSYHHIWFSQNARAYTAILFWTLFCTVLLYRSMSASSWPTLLGYSLGAALGAYTHPTFVFVVIGQAIAIVLSALSFLPATRDERVRIAKPLGAVALAGLLTLIFYAPIIGQVRQYYQQSSGKMRAVSTPSWALFEMIRGLQIGLGSLFVLAVAGLMLGCGLWGYWKRDRRAFFLLFCPMAVASLGMIAMRGSMYPRYLFMLFGFVILIIVRGAMVVGDFAANIGARKRDPAMGRLIGTLCMGLVIAASAATLGRVYRLPKQDFLGPLRFVESQRSPAEPVFTAGAAAWPYEHYYLRDWPKVKSVEKLRSIASQAGRVWLIYTFPRYIEDETPGLMDVIERDFETVRVFPGTLSNGEVYVCVKVSNQTPSL
jgi:4-amino-4-deoxy-L-arabinose transferase-like glycosyltransferase